jgi:hypothetical protein
MSISILSKIIINRSLTRDEIQSIENRAKNYDIDDIYLIEPKVWSDYDFEILCYKQALKDYLMDEYKIYQFIQEIIQYDYETM